MACPGHLPPGAPGHRPSHKVKHRDLGHKAVPQSHSEAPGRVAIFPSLPSYSMYHTWVFPENTFPGETQSTQYITSLDPSRLPGPAGALGSIRQGSTRDPPPTI